MRTYNISVAVYDEDMEKANNLVANMKDEKINSMSSLVRWLIRNEYNKRMVNSNENA